MGVGHREAGSEVQKAAEPRPPRGKGGNGMNVTTTETKKTVKSAFNDEFENYLKKQQIKTTFNGSELESFSWYRKALGLA